MIIVVSCKTNVVLGAWTECMLSKLALGIDTAPAAPKLCSFEWAPNGQHLAVRCAKHNYVLTVAS